MEPNDHVAAIVAASMADGTHALRSEQRTDLDSHANMFVAGCDAHILGSSGRTATVRGFSPDLDPIETPIVDCAFLYECPYSGQTYILLALNALYVPTMTHNLVPPFILREAGLVVNEIPKIQVPTPDESVHSIYNEDVDLRIPLALWGIFSYFPTRLPTVNELQDDANPVILLTPEGPWNPHTDVYARNEENMLDWEGKLVAPDDRPRIILDNIEDDDDMDASMAVCAVESKVIDRIATTRPTIAATTVDQPCWGAIPDEINDDRHLHDVNPILVGSSLANSLNERANLGEFCASAGATNGFYGDVLFPDMNDGDTLELGHVDLDDFMACSTTADASRGVTPAHLSKVWRIDHETAERTINATSQRCVRTESNHLSRNYSTNDRMLRYKRISQHFFMDTFFATKKAGKSSRGHTCMQLFVTDKGFVYVIAMKSKKDVPKAMKAFAKEVGAPDAIICDAAREQISQEVRTFCSKIGTALRVLEKDTPWANRAELYIGIIKEAVRRDMKDSDCPLVFWDYCAERRARINNLTARDLFQLESRNPHFSITGEEGDISNLCQFEWYEWIYFRDGQEGFPLPREVLGRCLGPAKGEGNEMTQWCLKANGNVVPRRTVRPLTAAEKTNETLREKRKIFDALITNKWGTSVSPPQEESQRLTDFDPYEDDEEQPHEIPAVDDPMDATGRAIDVQPVYDQLINAELLLPHEGEFKPARVMGRTTDQNGAAHGTYNSNPILNTMTYDVSFDDGNVKEYAANIIAENLLNQVDDEGFTITRLQCILDHRKNEDAVSREDMYLKTRSGKRIRKTTVGWSLLIRWHDSSEQWIQLSTLKESNPVEVAEYAKARRIDTEPAFAWWVPYTLRKRDVIVAAVNVRTRKTTHKYGIEVPTSVKHAYALDKVNGNDLWSQALKKEMRNVGAAFEILDPSKPTPPGWSKASGHLIFDVKMSLERKARWVLDGHLTPDVDYSTYAGVVSRESVRIALTYAALNGLDVWAADIRNAYIQAPSSCQDYIICGPEFGLENIGRTALIRRALYGGKTAGRDFRNHLRECMMHLGFESCKADPDVWMRAATKADGSKYWEYVLLYVDDCLVMSEQCESVLRHEIGRYFELKEESIGEPEIYLGGRLRKVKLENGADAWAFGSSQYVQAAIKNLEVQLRTKGIKLAMKANSPISTNYRPELDISPVLTPGEGAHYQSLIGILRWMVELGRVDICCEVSMMSSHLAMPREGHLEQLYHIFAYLKKHHNAEMVFDPSDPVIDRTKFERRDWTTSEMGFKLSEELPQHMPEPRGLGFSMRAFVDADHATDSMTRKSRTGFLVYLNNAPIFWMSRKQTSVETSSFGSEFTAMKQCTEYIRGLRYKLRMMGIPCDDPTFVYGDNQSVLYNTTIPESTLKKKSQSIAYHFVREGAARDEWRTTYVNTHLNPADLLTKPLSYGEKRRQFVRMILHHIYGEEGVE